MFYHWKLNKKGSILGRLFEFDGKTTHVYPESLSSLEFVVSKFRSSSFALWLHYIYDPWDCFFLPNKFTIIPPFMYQSHGLIWVKISILEGDFFLQNHLFFHTQREKCDIYTIFIFWGVYLLTETLYLSTCWWLACKQCSTPDFFLNRGLYYTI